MPYKFLINAFFEKKRQNTLEEHHPYIVKLRTQEGRTAKQIAEKLEEKGLNIKRRSVQNYLKKHELKRQIALSKSQNISSTQTEPLQTESKPKTEEIKKEDNNKIVQREPREREKKKKSNLDNINLLDEVVEDQKKNALKKR